MADLTEGMLVGTAAENIAAGAAVIVTYHEGGKSLLRAYRGEPPHERLTPGDIPGGAANLSRIMFEAREAADMWKDVVEKITGQRQTRMRRLVAEIDAYRASRGWPVDGYDTARDAT